MGQGDADASVDTRKPAVSLGLFTSAGCVTLAGMGQPASALDATVAGSRLSAVAIA